MLEMLKLHSVMKRHVCKSNIFNNLQPYKIKNKHDKIIYIHIERVYVYDEVCIGDYPSTIASCVMKSRNTLAH